MLPSGHYGEEPGISEAKELEARSPDLSGLRVLVVEDNFDHQLYFAVSLQQFGAEVKAAASVREAMETITRFKPNVLVSDLAMPGEDGVALIRRIRSLPREDGGRIPALAVTGLAGTEHRSRALWAGYQMYVCKPVDPHDLANRVAMLTDPCAEPAAAA